MQFLTDFADQAVVLPVAAVVLAALLFLRWWRGALAWAAGVAGVLATVLVLKLVVYACGPRMSWTGLVSPSGHTAAAAVVYGGLLALLVPRGAGTLVAALAGGGFAVAVGISRVVLHVHTVPDVIVGAVVGVAGAALLRLLAGQRPRRLAAPWLALAALAAMLLFHGHRLEAETGITWLALEIWPLTQCKAMTAAP